MAFDLHDMQGLQRELQEKYKGVWDPIDPAHARNKLLWMIGEAGEVAQVIKHDGDAAIAQEGEVRQAFIEEMCDVLMYWNDVCLCYAITPEEIESAWRIKHAKNMTRW